jgi:hypothetical protein
LADQREGTAEAREIERLGRLRDGEVRVRAAACREQAAVDRAMTLSEEGWRSAE